MDHTISGGTIHAIRVNGQELPEMGLNAAIAGYYKAPVILLTGDTETCAQASALFGPNVITAAVKEATGRFAARLFPRDEARARLRAAAKEALLKKDSIAPFRLTPPLTFDIEWQTSAQAEMPLLLPGIKRTAARSISFGAADYIEGFKLLRAAIALAAY
jgi:D-amino peptidase